MAAVRRPERSIEQVIADLDEDIRMARFDVDETLLDGTLAMSPRERLDAASATTRSLLALRSQVAQLTPSEQRSEDADDRADG